MVGPNAPAGATGRGAIAAGHPLSAQAGADVLATGGNAVDACLAAAFVAAVAEGPLTGPAGGGFMLVARPNEEPVVLDCFFAQPTQPFGVLEEVIVDFEGAGTQTFRVGEGSVAVPGLVAGLEEAHRRYCTIDWETLVEPALALARTGRVPVDPPRAFLHGILREILLRDDAGARVYGDPVHVATEELVATLERVRDVGTEAVAELVPELAADVRAYVVEARTPLVAPLLGMSVLTPPPPSRGGSIVLEILDSLAGLGEWSLADEARAVATAYERSWQGALTGTTHISVLDSDGTAVGLSSTLGSGSGIFRGGTQLNNMLGEVDVIGGGERKPGDRLPSMMAPTVVLESGRPRLVLGSAGSVRLAGAIAQVAWRVVNGVPVADAIDAPRLHAEGTTLHLEGGWSEDAVAGLPSSWNVVRWEALNLYFGGVQAVVRGPDGASDAAGDPRRGGVGVVVP
ncbi:MAG: gamma-glutamyltransferase [Actinobacteria bacterium]|nr:gamma-glutamyltransferase [Actinomycetota bacterium]